MVGNLSLIVVATTPEVGAERYAIEETIARSWSELERMIDEHRALADDLTASVDLQCERAAYSRPSSVPCHPVAVA